MILPPKPQKMILNFDATFAKVRDVVAAVVMMTALVNRRMLLVHQRSQKTAPVNLAMVKIAVKVARVRVRVAANLEKMILPPKPQKMILNFDAIFVKARNVVAVVVMTTAPVNLRMSLVSQKTAPVSPAMVMIANVDARVTGNHAKINLPPKPQKMILNFDATFVKASDVVAAVVMTTAPVNQRMLLVLQRRMSLVSQRTVLVNLVMIAKIAKIVENVKVVVILMTLLKNLMNQKVPQFLVDSFEKKQNELLTQPRSLVTEPKNPALVMIANVDVRVARGVAKNEKVKKKQLKHLKRFLHFDELLNEMDANAERELTRQSLTD